MAEDSKSFWTSLPGVLTALAGLVTAIATLIGTVYVAQPRVSSGHTTGMQTGSEDADGGVSASAHELESRSFRVAPVTLGSASLDSTLVQLGLYARYRSPIGNGVANRYRMESTQAGGVLIDDATGLMWHPGDTRTMDTKEAQAYVHALNLGAYAGHTGWRLPTVEEAATLLEPQALEGYQVDPVARSGPLYFQTADRSVDQRVWVVYFVDGSLVAENAEYRAPVRAVRTLR